MNHTPRRYRVRFERVGSLLRELGYCSDESMARFLGVGRTTVLKARLDSNEPSSKLMGAIQDRFPALPFEQLFERVASHPTGPAGPRPSPPPRPSGPGREAGAA